MTEKSEFDHSPPYRGGPTGGPKSNAYPQYPPQGGAYNPKGRAYTSSGGANVAQPGYRQAYSQTSTAVIVSQPRAAGNIHVISLPPDYTIPSIIACLFCFWPTGLCAIHFAMQANKLLAKGDLISAITMSNRARNLMVLSIVFGIIWITGVIVSEVVVT